VKPIDDLINQVHVPVIIPNASHELAAARFLRQGVHRAIYIYYNHKRDEETMSQNNPWKVKLLIDHQEQKSTTNTPTTNEKGLIRNLMMLSVSMHYP
jgi:hypothetical protein